MLTKPEVKIYNLNGSGKVTNGIEAFDKICKIDVSHFMSGVYIIQLQQNDKILKGKFIKE